MSGCSVQSVLQNLQHLLGRRRHSLACSAATAKSAHFSSFFVDVLLTFSVWRARALAHTKLSTAAAAANAHTRTNAIANDPIKEKCKSPMVFLLHSGVVRSLHFFFANEKKQKCTKTINYARVIASLLLLPPRLHSFTSVESCAVTSTECCNIHRRYYRRFESKWYTNCTL